MRLLAVLWAAVGALVAGATVAVCVGAQERWLLLVVVAGWAVLVVVDVARWLAGRRPGRSSEDRPIL